MNISECNDQLVVCADWLLSYPSDATRSLSPVTQKWGADIRSLLDENKRLRKACEAWLRYDSIDCRNGGRALYLTKLALKEPTT